MTITLRIPKGSPLTIAELDGNFTDLDERLQDVEDNQLTYRSIEEITQSGNSITVIYTDSTTDGPFTFDVLISYRGDWAAATSYAQNDLVKANGIIYLVRIAHVSAGTFDPGASAGSDGDFYQPFLELPELSLPAGGGEGFVLTKASTSDYDFEWQARGIPTGGSTGYVLTKLSADDFDADWVAAPAAPVLTITSATFDANLDGYSGVYFRCTNSTGCVITIPSHATHPFAEGTEMHFRQCAGGNVTIVGESDSDGPVVQINGIDGCDDETSITGAVITVKKVSNNSWDLWGLLSTTNSDTA